MPYLSLMKLPGIKFSDFITRFPVVELPVTLNEDSISYFGNANDPFQPELVRTYLEPGMGGNDDGMTEYVPCFKLPETHDFHAVVFWKSGLLKYEFILSTFSKDGQLISSATLAGMTSDGRDLLRSVATIDEDWKIHIVEGEQSAVEGQYSPYNTRAYQMELLSTGEIIFLLTGGE